jgi:hypothetical protein
MQIIKLNLKDGGSEVEIVVEDDLVALRIEEFFKWAFEAGDERDYFSSLLEDIGNFAHEHSTGPAVEDDLWEVRRMAFQL